jgi:hypothetical protein
MTVCQRVASSVALASKSSHSAALQPLAAGLPASGGVVGELPALPDGLVLPASLAPARPPLPAVDVLGEPASVLERDALVPAVFDGLVLGEPAPPLPLPLPPALLPEAPTLSTWVVAAVPAVQSAAALVVELGEHSPVVAPVDACGLELDGVEHALPLMAAVRASASADSGRVLDTNMIAVARCALAVMGGAGRADRVTR